MESSRLGIIQTSRLAQIDLSFDGVTTDRPHDNRAAVKPHRQFGDLSCENRAASSPPLPLGEGLGVRAERATKLKIISFIPRSTRPHPGPLPEGEGVRAQFSSSAFQDA